MKTHTIRLTEKEFIAARRLAFKPTGWMRWTLLLFFLWLAFAILRLLLLPAFGYEAQWGQLPAIAFIACYAVLVYWWLIHRTSKRLFRQQASLRAPFSAEITDGTIRFVSEQGENVLKLSELHKWRMNKDLILLYHSDAVFQLLQRRAFASNDDREKFIAQLRETLGRPR